MHTKTSLNKVFLLESRAWACAERFEKSLAFMSASPSPSISSAAQDGEDRGGEEETARTSGERTTVDLHLLEQLERELELMHESTFDGAAALPLRLQSLHRGRTSPMRLRMLHPSIEREMIRTDLNGNEDEDIYMLLCCNRRRTQTHDDWQQQHRRSVAV